mgnify:CR=1 FL=1|jgi:hypothetical protein
MREVEMHELAFEDSARDGARSVVILSSRGVTRYLQILKKQTKNFEFFLPFGTK